MKICPFWYQNAIGIDTSKWQIYPSGGIWEKACFLRTNSGSRKACFLAYNFKNRWLWRFFDYTSKTCLEYRYSYEHGHVWSIVSLWDFVMFDVCARYARASTLPHREWLSFSIYISIYKRDTYREYILLSLLREEDTRETDISHFREYSSVFFRTWCAASCSWKIRAVVSEIRFIKVYRYI